MVKKVTTKISKTIKKNDKMTVPVYSLVGKETGTLKLPKEIFGVKVNKQLLAQALRVYMTNQKNMTASTKTRGEIKMTTAKWFKQKGTGRARHGAKSAPIFVGGGVAFGPRPRNVRLALPQKMKKAALLSAISVKTEDLDVLTVTGLEKASGKTKQMVGFLGKLKLKSALIVTGEKIDSAVRAVRNIPGVDILPVNLINTYEVLRHQKLILTKEAVEGLQPKADK